MRALIATSALVLASAISAPALLLSAALLAVTVPTLSLWLQARDGFDLSLYTSVLALGVLGGLVIVVADVLGEALRSTGALRTENDGFIWWACADGGDCAAGRDDGPAQT